MANNERTIERAQLLARLAAERAGLLEQLIGLDERTLTEVPLLDDWTVKDLLAHIAAWDRWELREMRHMASGEILDLTEVRNTDAFNAHAVAARRDRTLAEVLAELQEARSHWVAWLQALPDEKFYRQHLFEGEDWSCPGCVEVQWRHDAEHAAQIAAWRETEGLKGKTGPKAVLLTALAAARDELLTAAALVPAEERASRPVCGEWTLKDVLGHVADWEWFGMEGLREMAAGHAPQVERIESIEDWNRAHADARRHQPWETVWADLHAARRALLEVIEEISLAELGRSFPFPWGPEGTAYRWVYVYLAHDREHAEGFRTIIDEGRL